MDDIKVLYGHLRECFGRIRDEVLGEDYYTCEMSVSGSDKKTTFAIIRTIRRIRTAMKWSLIFNIVLSFTLALVLIHLVL
jgi:hypothetical protein